MIGMGTASRNGEDYVGIMTSSLFGGGGGGGVGGNNSSNPFAVSACPLIRRVYL